MAKRTHQQKDLTGQESKPYLYNGDIVFEANSFIYCLKVYKYWKFGSCELGERFFTSNKILEMKSFNQIVYYQNYTIEKDISLIGVPSEFIKDNKLPLYEPNVKLKCRRQKK